MEWKTIDRKGFRRELENLSRWCLVFGKGPRMKMCSRLVSEVRRDLKITGEVFGALDTAYSFCADQKGAKSLCLHLADGLSRAAGFEPMPLEGTRRKRR